MPNIFNSFNNADSLIYEEIIYPSVKFAVFFIWVASILIIVLHLCKPVKNSEFISLISSREDNFCITNSSSAMVYKGDQNLRVKETAFLPAIGYFCDFENNRNENCINSFAVHPWNLVHSFNHESTFLLDLRWERLHVRKLPFKNNGTLAFFTLVKLTGSTDFKVPISLMGEETHLLLCDKENVEQANCYWFILQGWNRKRSAMRKCKIGEIIPSKNYPKGDCFDKIVEKSHSNELPLYLFEDKWCHIMIERKTKTLSLKLYNEGKEENIIDYTEKDAKMFELNYLIGHRKKGEVFCKVHENNYMRSTAPSEFILQYAFTTGVEPCISIILKTCSYCSTTVLFLDVEKKTVMLERNIPPTNGIWEHHKVITNVTISPFFYVKLKTMLTKGSFSAGNEFWSFDNFRECHKEEYRITQKENSKRISECQLLTNNRKVEMDETIDSLTDEICSFPDTIGSSCIACSLFTPRIYVTKCKKLKICEEYNGDNRCYCSSGYMGSQCNEVCQTGTYGYFCRNRCAFCNPVDKCDVTNGSCTCNNLFEGTTCQLPKKGQYSKFPPKVIDRKADSCEIQWDSENYIGKTKPKYYLVQYANQQSKWWMDYGNVENLEKNGTALIENLDSYTQYAIRVLLSDEIHDIKKLQSTKLPSTICSTTCNDWIEDDIFMKTTSKTVNIHLNLTKDKCPLSLYEYSIQDDQNETISKGGATNVLYQENLYSFKSYCVTFKSKNQIIKKNFRTQEGVPSEVNDLQMAESTANSMKIHWKEPNFPNGDIVGYKVTYKKVRRISCTLENLQNSESEMNTTKSNIELISLEAYSEYQVTIYAFNGLNIGGGSGIFLRTKGLDYFNDSEDFKQVLITHETVVRSASVKLQNIKCEKLLGPLAFTVKFRCISKWCLQTDERNETSTSHIGSLTLWSLQPYCKYKYEIYFCRNETCKLQDERTLETKTSVPNKLKEIIVIATGNAFIWIRWLPPYPPTGKISFYKITSNYESYYNTYSGTNTFHPEYCEIWPDYLCYKIEGDGIYYEKKTTLVIEATNEEKFEYVNIGRVTDILVQESPSEVPNNLFIIWSLNHTMELFWNHPNRTNGLLRYFDIKINSSNNGTFMKQYVPPRWNLTYNYKVSKVSTAEDFTIQITAVNNKYEGLPAVLVDSSYPPSPELENSTIFVTNYTKTTVSIALSTSQAEVSHSNIEKYVLVIINDQASETTDQNLEKLEKIVNTTFEMGSRLRIVAILDVKKISSNILNFTIGNGDEIKNNSILNVDIMNKPLKEAKYYNVVIIMLNKYRTKYRHSIYNIKTLTSGDPRMTPPPTIPEKRSEKEDDSSGGNALYALLLLLLLIPIIVGVILKRKIKLFFRHRSHSHENIYNTYECPISVEDHHYETIPLDRKVNQELSIKETNEHKYDYIEIGNVADMAGGRNLDSEVDHFYEIVKPPMVKTKNSAMNVPHKLSITRTSPTRKTTSPPNPPPYIHSNPIKMTKFEEYVKTSIESGELERQHALFPMGQTQPWQYGSTEVNRPKNLYKHLIAFDHSRVLLEKIYGDEHSDYINANYIYGHNMERAYIATQGPKVTTLFDFWRMIWQENVKHIVLLADVYGGGKKKIEKYWPNLNEKLTFRDIVIHYKSMKLYANFECRNFQVTKGQETKEIEQLHFTTWPVDGVPLYPQTLVPFLLKILKLRLSPTSPIVVHCSAGVGSTGTILLIDICLRMAAKEGIVDVLNNLQKLREQRPNMVENIEQYKLAHLVALECLMSLDTSIPCDEQFEKNVQNIIDNKSYKQQMKYLKDTEWRDQVMSSEICDEILPNFSEKNRIQQIFPEKHGRILLSRYPDDDQYSSYINAVSVDGFRCHGRFVITQQPMPNTVGDFWRLVTEKKIKVILSLNEVDLKDETCCKFWPTTDDPPFKPVDFLLVEFVDVEELKFCDIFSLQVWKNGKKKRKLDVKVVSFKYWPSKSMLPSSCEKLLSFYEKVDAISRGSSKVLVTCFDGVTASGVYVAMSFIIEQMKLEHECDVCLAVRTIRHNRKQFVIDENQFIFLYECAVEFKKGFQSYANFQNQIKETWDFD